MKILLIAEYDNYQTIKLSTQHALSAALQLGSEVDLLIVGENCQKAGDNACFLAVKNVLLANNAVYAHQLAENTAALIAELGKQYDYIIMAATTFGKNILP